MAQIDVLFMKGNQETVKAMATKKKSTTVRKSKPTAKKAASKKK